MLVLNATALVIIFSSLTLFPPFARSIGTLSSPFQLSGNLKSFCSNKIPSPTVVGTIRGPKRPKVSLPSKNFMRHESCITVSCANSAFVWSRERGLSGADQNQLLVQLPVWRERAKHELSGNVLDLFMFHGRDRVGAEYKVHVDRGKRSNTSNVR